MTRTRTLHRWTLAALAAATLALTIAQTAQADPGWRRWKHAEHGRWGRPAHRVVYREVDHGSAGPALAGLIGGFVLGATFGHPQAVVVHERVCAPPPSHYRYEDRGYTPPPPPQPLYRYEDVSGDRWWDTLDECREAAANDRDGPRVIKVMDARTNRCVETLYWKHDHFVSDDDRADDDRGPYRNDDSRDN
jgi:hypothetical protein